LNKRDVITVTIDLKALGFRLVSSGRKYVRVNELAYELGISNITAGRILSKLTKLGFVEKWSNGIYRVTDYFIENDTLF